MKIYLQLFYTFAKIGLFTFGGGLSMLPMLEREIINKNAWASEEELMDYYAISRCTPGIIAINVATFIGKKKGGIPGAISATFGMVFPSLVIIIVIAAFISNFAHLAAVQYAFAGIRVCVSVQILMSVWKLLKKAVVDLPTALIFAAVTVLMVAFNPSPIIFVLAAAVIGCVIGAVKSGS